MGIIDILIIIILLFFAIIGFHRGVFKSLIIFLGFIIVLFLSYYCKNYIGDFFVLNLPFVKFSKLLLGISTINIVMYQILAFIIMLIIFGLVYRFLITISGIFEKILRITIVLGIPSKLLGMLFGFLEGCIVIYLALFFLKQPFLNFDLINESKYAPIILNKTPVISSYAESGLKLINEIQDISKIDSANEKDLRMAELILKEKVTSPEIMQKLVDKGKIKIVGIQDTINRYKKIG